MPRKKGKSQAEPHWQVLVDCYFVFCQEKCGDKPSFDGSAPKDMKLILKTLRERAESKSVDWTENIALGMWSKFLEYAFKDRWLQKNFLLFQLNRQKDKIIFEIANDKSKQNKPTYQDHVTNALKNFRPMAEQ